MGIRNICLLGHGSEGKTSLAESMLFATGGTDRLGRVADGNTVCDFDPEEVRRKISISATPVPVEFGECKLNVIDTPGYFDFSGEVLQGLRVADTAVIVASAKSGVGVGAEKGWRYSAGKARFVYVSKVDEENANFSGTFDALRERFGISVCPVVIPASKGDKVSGVINIVTGKAYTVNGGKPAEIPVPADMAGTVKEYLATLSENVAETDEALMDKFFSEEPFTAEELQKGIRAGVLAGSLTPVFCGCAMTGLGTELLLQGIADYAPAPGELGDETAADGKPFKQDPAGPATLLVFKTLIDQYGKFSFFKVVSGTVTADMTLQNARSGQAEKLGHLFIVKGKKNTEVKEIKCGDIGAVSKLTDTKTGDTLCASSPAVALRGIAFPEPCYALAFAPKTKGGEEKIASGLTRMAEEDLTFTVKNDAEIKQFVVTGQGDIHLDVLCSRLKSRFGVEVETEAPRVAYREKIRRKVTGIEGKHKKQSGGHGQFGLVIMDFEPAESEEVVFEETVVGGNVPKQYFPAVEKGLRECVLRGVLAGYPVVGLKATLTDGKYHDVDSSEMAFKLATRLAYRAGLPQAGPVLLEPVGALRVLIPDAYMGDIIGDLNKRRGRVMGMNPAEDGGQVVEAEVPIAEMNTYAIDLRSMTQGRGSFSLTFERYEETPPNVQQKVIEEAKHLEEEEE
ncbi:MAG: elongation factor G [Oscillospiraceae bacterium]|jgi:elongation factor G|nr:elongation factor G [Oscillospiraceae bacterium]